MTKFTRPRGTQDLMGDPMRVWETVERRLALLARRYGYEQIRTPIFESSELFVRAVGEGTDIVSKEMYVFTDKKGRSLTLRPENTAPVMRAFLESGLHRGGGITRFWYCGPMFRYDRPQAGRYRQFHQFGAEALGSPGPAVDAEIIDLSLSVYREFGFTGLELHLNSVGCPVCRPAFRNLLSARLEELRGELCGTCADRAITNPMRIFDCKECEGVKAKLPVITDHLCEGCRTHFAGLQEILRRMETDFILDPLLVRGLDYYTRTAYEILQPGPGGQNALCGGGRYDGLAQECGGPPVPAIGFSAGMERLLENLPGSFVRDLERERPDLFIVVPSADAVADALAVASNLRRSGVAVGIDLTERSVKKQMRAAADSGALRAVIIGPEETASREASVKILATGEQVRIPFEKLAGSLSKERNCGGE